MGGGGPIPYAAWGIDGATAQFGMQLGQNAMSAGQEYVTKNVCYYHRVLSLKSVTELESGCIVGRIDPAERVEATLRRLELLRRA